MPELPEVENTVRRLRPEVVGRSIRAVEIGWRRTVAAPGSRAFCRALCGRRIAGVARRGKFIIFSFEGPGRLCLIAHLRMSGSFHVTPLGRKGPRFVRLSFVLSGRRRLCFKDARKFGRFWLVRDAAQIIGGLGPEPLAREFTCRDFLVRLQSKSGMIKPLLLRQDFLAGVGNIYADESLWRAGIHPRRRAKSLSAAEAGALYHAIRGTLRRAIRAQGTDIGDEVVRGDYVPAVYRRRGEGCRRCRTAIVRTVIGQRGTYLCPRCQKLGK